MEPRKSAIAGDSLIMEIFFQARRAEICLAWSNAPGQLMIPSLSPFPE
jgi:hypothetical protein